MDKIAGIGRPVLLNSLENWAKTARDPRENFAGLAAGETSLSRFLAPACLRCAASTIILSTFSGLWGLEVHVKTAKFFCNFGGLDV
jgi:hypothetical protein